MSAPRDSIPDDERWASEHPSSNGASPAARGERIAPLIALGYITAVAIPPVGLAIGIRLTIRPLAPRSKHGPLMILLSVVAMVAWVLVLSSGALSTGSNENY